MCSAGFVMIGSLVLLSEIWIWSGIYVSNNFGFAICFVCKSVFYDLWCLNELSCFCWILTCAVYWSIVKFMLPSISFVLFCKSLRNVYLIWAIWLEKKYKCGIDLYNCTIYTIWHTQNLYLIFSECNCMVHLICMVYLIISIYFKTACFIYIIIIPLQYFLAFLFIYLFFSFVAGIWLEII